VRTQHNDRDAVEVSGLADVRVEDDQKSLPSELGDHSVGRSARTRPVMLWWMLRSRGGQLPHREEIKTSC
jgi:hypothetical protein